MQGIGVGKNNNSRSEVFRLMLKMISLKMIPLNEIHIGKDGLQGGEAVLVSLFFRNKAVLFL